jgi:hypothetical protein
MSLFASRDYFKLVNLYSSLFFANHLSSWNRCGSSGQIVHLWSNNLVSMTCFMTIAMVYIPFGWSIILVCPGLKGFPECGTFSANIGKVSGKPGQVGHPSINPKVLCHELCPIYTTDPLSWKTCSKIICTQIPKSLSATPYSSPLWLLSSVKVLFSLPVVGLRNVAFLDQQIIPVISCFMYAVWFNFSVEMTVTVSAV